MERHVIKSETGIHDVTMEWNVSIFNMLLNAYVAELILK